MKKFFLHIFLVGVLGMLTVSCNDTEMVEYLDTNTTQVMFSLGMDSPVTRTRATKATDDTWGSDYSPKDGGDAYDNRINPDQLYVKITHGGKTYDVKKILKWQDKDDASLHTFVGEVDIDLNGQPKKMENAKIEVFANWNPDAENGDVFSQSAQYIPMWGVQTATITLTPGKRETLNTIYLLRAMAKIQVSLNDEMVKEYSLSEVTLNKHNATGICLPTGAEGAANTKELGLEDVLNAKKSSEQTPLAFKKDGDSYVVYLPEVVNDGSSEDDWLKISVKLKETATGSEEEGSFFIKDYSNEDNPVAIDIIRNHWYKYTIKGFAASEIFVEYKALPWQEVGMEIGGDGFLFLNEDVIEIYNSNISEGVLKFASSSPILSIELKDTFNHYNNGDIKEPSVGEEKDGVSAYYLSKYGQKIQLGTDPGFDVTDKEAALAREQVILSNISATAEENTLNGYITINSPFLADPTNEIPELQQNSHYDTPRYLEFLVTNQQGLTATFRVMQYPPVVITNEEGYFSYRSDQKFSDDQEEASHYHNYMGWKSFHLTGLMWGYEFDWTNVPEKEDEDWFIGNSAKNYSSVVDNKNAVTTKAFCEVLHYGNLGAPHSFVDNREVTFTTKYGGLYKSTTYPTDAFLRHRYYQYPGGQTTGIYKYQGYSFNSKIYDYPRGDIQGLAVGPYYERDGRTYRKQFVWNIQPIFYNLYVSKVYDKNENGKLKGQADLNSMTYSVTMEPGITDGKWVSWGKQGYTNHRMYIIRTTTSSSDYNVGYPTLTVDGVTENTKSNANMMSPKFAVASQLGETRYQSIITLAKKNNYKVPVVGEFYKLAVEHCREYVETTFIDKDGDHEWDKGETVIHYDDWRLPTKAEINAIINYQNASRAMDKLLIGQYYFCAAGGGENADVNIKENWVSGEVAGYSSDMTGYYIRCVRDVKPNENK